MPRQNKSRRRTSAAKSPNARQLRVEQLEDRRLLAVLTVQNNLDDTLANLTGDGELSLREAIEIANNPGTVIDGFVSHDVADTIDFSSAFFDSPQTIALTAGELEITQVLNIDAGALPEYQITIDAQLRSRLLNYSADSGDLVVQGVILRNGQTTGDNVNGLDTTYSGGGIRFLSDGSLMLNNSQLSHSSTTGVGARGGGIYSPFGNVVLDDSSLFQNRTAGRSALGGGLYTSTGDVLVASSFLQSNHTNGDDSDGGALSSGTGNVTIVDSTISNNFTTGRGGGRRVIGGGGGIASASGLVSLTNTTLHANFTSGTAASGGGLNSGYGDVVVVGSIVTNNETRGNTLGANIGSSGGGIYSLSTITITDSIVQENSTSGDRAAGGGVYARGDVTLRDSTVSGNQTFNRVANGGGIATSDGSVNVTNSNLRENKTWGIYSRGGGIFSENGNVTLNESTISGNNTVGTRSAGGGIYTKRGTAILTNSTLNANKTIGTYSPGGGIHAGYGATISGSTVSGNSTVGTSSGGGGIYSSYGNVTIMDSTLTLNSTAGNSSSGGGIFALARRQHFFTVQNSIVAANTTAAGSLGPDLMPDSRSTLFVDHSLIGDTTDTGIDAGTGSSNLLNVDPMLGPLAANSGPTMTHAPQTDSPVINNGSSMSSFDQRGEPFLRDDGGGVDIGAHETQGFAPSFFFVTTIDDELDFSNADVSLREAIYTANGNSGTNSITFDSRLAGHTIFMDYGDFEVAKSLTIDALLLDGGVIIDAQRQSRIFDMNSASEDLTLAGLTLQGGLTTGDNSTTPHFTLNPSDGGGIRFNSRGTLTLLKTTLRANQTTGDRAMGGGIYTRDGNVSLIESLAYQNSTEGDRSPGGGIYTRSGDVTLLDSALYENSTRDDRTDGGGIYSWSGDVTLLRSSLYRNSTELTRGEGGGILAYLGNVQVLDSTLSENHASEGGGISTFSGDITISNSTLIGNRASAGSSIIASSLPTTRNANIAIQNSIVAGNTQDLSNFGSDVFVDFNKTLDVDFSLIGHTRNSRINAITGIGNLLNIDPLLGPLAYNGGPTQTHALLPGSPALDAGDPSIPFLPTENDQRGIGFSRVAFDRIDMGAYESHVTPSADFDADGDVDGSDFLTWQRGFGMENAVRADGNSDDDSDVDASDLAAWTLTYGQGSVASGRGSGISGQGSVAAGQQAEDGEELNAAARAWALLGESADFDESPVVEQQIITANPFASYGNVRLLAPVANRNAYPEVDASEEDRSDSKAWLSDELLDGVFG